MRVRRRKFQPRLSRVLALLAFITMCPAQAQDIPPEVISAAQTGLPAFLQRIPPGAAGDYGFAPGDSLSQAKLAHPFKVNTIKPADLLAAPPGTSILGMLSETNLWYFPVLINGTSRAILVVDLVDGQWRAVSLGYANLAGSLGTVRQRWPRAKGFNPKLIAVFQAKQFLVLVPEENPDLLFGVGGPDRKLQVETTARVLEKLKPLVSESLKQDDKGR